VEGKRTRKGILLELVLGCWNKSERNRT